MEYKFRGFDATGQKGWVYGDLVHNKKVTRTGLEPRVMVGGYEVVPESVGLCSGLKDSAGNDIYLGDIVRWSKDRKKYLVVFRAGMFYASVEEFNKGVYGGFPLWVLCEEEKPCKVIGNIFEK
jgi:hypothetical protein